MTRLMISRELTISRTVEWFQRKSKLKIIDGADVVDLVNYRLIGIFWFKDKWIK